MINDVLSFEFTKLWVDLKSYWALKKIVADHCGDKNFLDVLPS